MNNQYLGVVTRFLRKDERFILSEEQEMPLVIEAKDSTNIEFLQTFLADHSAELLKDISDYGAVLLRGFEVNSDSDFEESILKIKGYRGISEAFMSEEGRIHPNHLNYVLYTNAVYKTGGTLYLGGFHSENYYSPDVPSYINFCCMNPSSLGGETGLINMEKIYQLLGNDLKKRLESKSFFVSKWMVTEVAKRYHLSVETIEKICSDFDLPIVGKGNNKCILMYKPSVFLHPVTKQKTLQINLFEVLGLNEELRKCFVKDYQGSAWFWHRFVWRLPRSVFHVIELVYVMLASFFYSPKDSLAILKAKIHVLMASHGKNKLPPFNNERVGSCFNDRDIKELAKLMRENYSSFLWKKGDILLIDNKKVAHAGMPGSGPRLIRALICNPIELNCSFMEPAPLDCNDRMTESIGSHMASGD